ncbi:MAG: hypothetical protein V3V16_11005 [Melioribacteraceae bacterium]
MKKIIPILTLFFIFLISSCSESIVETTPTIDETDFQNPISTTFASIQTNVLNKSCALSGCHVSGIVAPDLAGNAYNRIVNKAGSTGLNYIEPNNPENSYLLKKIIGQNISGSRMPRGASPLSQSVVDSISSWINDGAKNN